MNEQADFAKSLGTAQRQVERFMAKRLAVSAAYRPKRLAAAMRHGVLNGGKRLRPYLLIETARIFGLTGNGPLRAAAAIEFVHCYSLIHDDLPSFDNDDLRRGQPTVHRAFDDATAILAGDALLTEAFRLIAEPQTSPSAEIRAALVQSLALESGYLGMAGGQMLDLEAEGRFDKRGKALHEARRRPQALGAASIAALQTMKTGALIRFSVLAGWRIAGSPGSARTGRALDSYARALGLAFQIKDDLLDAEGDAALLGKAAGKDKAAGKATFVSLLGLEGAKSRLADATRQGERALAGGAERLEALLAFNMARQS